ncbi:protein Wnt-8a isoform X1 [Anas acuta]|uniref:protein Wnt-8a isoform X1 n=1 Tax=Anas acuta TaxID=28680 RepID=UPI0035C89511
MAGTNQVPGDVRDQQPWREQDWGTIVPSYCCQETVPCTDTCRILCQIAETIDAEAGKDSSHEHFIPVAPYLLHKLFCYSLLAPLQRCRFHKRAPFPINQYRCVCLHVTAFFSSPPATRETSFVHAISSAGVMYTLTRNCSMGDFESCGCDDSRNGRVGGRGWVWGGCSDNVEFGERISKLFVDALETGHDTRALINLHNNEVGRLAVKATMKRACKCHGVSGSCSIQTCWLQLAEFREIGNYLKMKYDQAHKLEMDKRRMRAGNSADSRGATAETFHHVHATELVFLEDSPDYCTRNASLGHHGTEGRECLQTGKNLSQWEKRSCRRLCTECGLKVEERRTEVVTSCNCKFHWCCTVRCEQCRQLVAKHYCARRDAATTNHIKRKNKGHKR